MINSASHDSVSRLVADRPMCLATALDKAFENIDCMSAILRCQAKNRFYESTQRLIQPRRVLWFQLSNSTSRQLDSNTYGLYVWLCKKERTQSRVLLEHTSFASPSIWLRFDANNPTASY